MKLTTGVGLFMHGLVSKFEAVKDFKIVPQWLKHQWKVSIWYFQYSYNRPHWRIVLLNSSVRFEVIGSFKFQR